MGLLDRWSKRKKQEQLEKTTDEKVVETVKTAVKAVETKAVKTTAKKAVSTKVAAKKTSTKTKKEEPVAVAAPETEEKKNILVSKILIKPLVTEKSAIAESLNKYSFLVHRSANKYQVKQAVFEMYGVKPTAVNVTNVQGKWVRFGRSMGRHSDFRKAIVTLPKGKTIAVHKGV